MMRGGGAAQGWGGGGVEVSEEWGIWKGELGTGAKEARLAVSVGEKGGGRMEGWWNFCVEAG